jgi:hypothetical protein
MVCRCFIITFQHVPWVHLTFLGIKSQTTRSFTSLFYQTQRWLRV